MSEEGRGVLGGEGGREAREKEKRKEAEGREGKGVCPDHTGPHLSSAPTRAPEHCLHEASLTPALTHLPQGHPTLLAVVLGFHKPGLSPSIHVPLWPVSLPGAKDFCWNSGWTYLSPSGLGGIAGMGNSFATMKEDILQWKPTPGTEDNGAMGNNWTIHDTTEQLSPAVGHADKS